VVNELRGEKIDVIRWSPDPATYIANALSPARVDEVRLVDPEGRQAHVLVAEDQLSLAIGKEGQNVRLAARLTGWKIDIKDSAKYDYEAENRKIAATLETRRQAQALLEEQQRQREEEEDQDEYLDEDLPVEEFEPEEEELEEEELEEEELEEEELEEEELEEEELEEELEEEFEEELEPSDRETGTGSDGFGSESDEALQRP
jgi:N utilization substance protein A